jgi:two-component system OmpR family sensor kinase
MRATRTLFWKFFLAIWVGYVLLIGISVLWLEAEYKSRFSEFEVSERYSNLANFIIQAYELGIDLPRNEIRRREGSGNIEGRNDSLVILDVLNDRVVYGDREWLELQNRRVDIMFRAADSGNFYRMNVAIPPLRSPLPDLASPMSFGIALCTSLLYSWFFTLALTRPITRLKSHVQLLGRGGNLDQKLEAKLMSRRDEIGDLASSIDEMSEYIQELLNSKQRLLFDVSHELRAPLARMQVAAGIVRAEAESIGSDISMHDRVEHEVESLNALISELLLLAKTENGGTDRQIVSLPEELDGVIEDMKFGAKDRIITPHLNIESADVEISIQLLDRVVKNLVENALKYSEGEVCVYLDGEDSDWIIRVEDSGDGIPDDQLEAMFQPFTRLQSESVEGFGLGLSIAIRAAQTMGGTLSLENRSEGGLLATLRLPKN